MRKKILVTVAVLVLLILLIFGYLQYRQYSSYKVPIHAGVNTIVKINADAFILSFLKEFGFNYKKQLGPPKTSTTDSTPSMGISIPANFFIYNLNNRATSTLFTVVPLSDVDNFKKNLVRRFGFALSNHGKFSLANKSDSEVTVLMSSEFAAIAYSKNKEEVVTVLDDLIAGKGLIDPDDDLLRRLKKDQSHLVCISPFGWVHGRISGKQIEFDGKLATYKELLIPLQSHQRRKDSSSYATFFFNGGNGSIYSQKNFQLKEHVFETDSLLFYFDGYTDIDFKGMFRQADTITTFAYTDNFEKIPVQTIDSVKTPDIDIFVSSRPNVLRYLEKQDLTTNAGIVNRDVFPLYRLFVNPTENGVTFSTVGHRYSAAQFLPSPFFAELNIDVRKLSRLLDSTSLQGYTDGVNHINFNGKRETDSTFILNGTINCNVAAIRVIVKLAIK